MMPHYDLVPLEFEPWHGSKQPIFRKSRATFRQSEILQESRAEGSLRQRFFEEQLLRMSSVMPNRLVPVFSRWNDGIPRRLDLGCIGHSLKREFIERPINGDAGYITHLIIRQR